MKQILHNFKSNSRYQIRVLLLTGLFSMFTSFATAQTTAVPDNAFETRLIALGYDSGPLDDLVLTANINGVTSLDISGLGISNLTGIQDFAALQTLICESNLLTGSLDLSMLTNLTSINVFNNQLTSLNFTGLNLTYLACDQNQISSLNVSALTNLQTFYCATNLLTSIDVSGLANLTLFECGNNPLLSNVDVRGCNFSSYFYCAASPKLSCVLVSSLPVGYTVFKDASTTFCTLTTWTAGAWNPAAPTATTTAVIESAYSAAADITACSLTIKNSAAVTIPSNFNVNLAGALTVTTGSTFTLSNNANLVQTNPASTNSGAITVNRNSSLLSRLDYTLWSSPVVNQNLLAFSPATSTNRFYNFDTTYNTGGVSGAFSVIANPASTSFAIGSGYLIRMPNNALDFPTTQTFNGQFTGVPSNGDVPVTLIDGGSAALRYNLVGNPYPSPISLSTFVTENTTAIESNLYFWRKTNGLGTAYCTWVPGPGLTGTFTTNGNLQSVDPVGVLQSGQGFFVQAKAGQTEAIFRNTQRVAINANQFFKTSKIVVDSRIWLNATNAAGDFSQMAVTYGAKGTLGVDMYDGKYINDSPFALTSNVNNEEYTIQGRPAFVPSDVVALNFKTATAGQYTISIDHVDGLFLGNQDIYLVDSKTGTETNLKTSSYTFTAAAAVDNTRFSLKFQKTLSLDAQELNDNSVIVYKNDGVIYVNSGAKTINNIKVFDILGRVVTERNNVKANTASIQNLRASNQVLIVKVTTDDNQVISKKVEN
jgi:hypothetical protein